MRSYAILILMSFCLEFSGQSHSKSGKNAPSDLNLGDMVQPVPLANRFFDENYNIWCGSVTTGKNGKYYMLYSRWPRSDGHYAWVISSEVALAVSDRPEGPFSHVRVVLPARGSEFWDGCATHNPQVMKYKGKYYLYYMGTTGKGNPDKPYTMKDDKWWEYRNNQRIGVAVATDPEGEWTRFDRPVVDVSPDSAAYDALMVSNPAATADDKGNIIITYKQVARQPGRLQGGKVRFGVAFARSPLGPFKKEPHPVFEVKEGADAWMIAEDPYIWFQNKTYYAIVRDVIGKFTGDAGAWALIISKDGKDWQPGKFPKVIGSRFIWEDSTQSIGQLERPCILIEKGIPKMLYGAYILNKDRSHSCNVAVPLLAENAFPMVHVDVDWPVFLSRHDMIWEKFPTEFDEGGFIGNGLLGATLYQEGEQRVRFEMGRADVTEHRRNNNRLPIGGLALETEGKIMNGTLRLDLWNAELRGELKTDKGNIRFRSLIHTREMVLLTDLETQGEESNARITWEAAPCIDDVCSKRFPEDPANPPPNMEKPDGIPVCIQDRFAGGQFATAWTEIVLPHKRRIILSIADSYPGKTAKEQAVKTVTNIKGADFEALLQSHREWWHAFYPQSFVSIPDQKLESFYWIQWYKMAGASRPGPLITDLLGPWYRKTIWSRVYSDMNVQSLYMPVYTANRMVLGESLTGHLDTWRNSYFLNAKEQFGLDDAAYLPCSVDNEGRRGTGNPPQSEKTRRLWAIPGNLTWLLHNYYMHYRHTMDHSYVLDTEKHALYPLLRANINLFLHLLEEGEDGKLHLPERYSPEYFEPGTDSNYDLSLLRWGTQTLLDLNRRYNLKDPLAPRWQETLDKLAGFPADENGFSIAAGVSLKKSHRHWSHLLMFHPLHILEPDIPENRRLLEKSLHHWLTVESGKEIYGWSHAAASSLYSTLGDGEKALHHIHAHLADKRFVSTNTMYLEKDPVLECSIVINRALQDMLLKSRGDLIRIFPALPADWKDVLFHDFRAEGAFLVSAERKDGRTIWIRIKSLAGEPCRIMPGITGKMGTTRKNAIKPAGNGQYELFLKKGEEIVLYSGESLPELKVRPLPADPEGRNPYGVKSVKNEER